MLNPKAIDTFLSRKLASYDWVKDLSRSELGAEFKSMHPVPHFGGSSPWDHQAACFLLLNELKRFILHISMGGGKTFMSLMMLSYRKQCGEKHRMVVFVPYVSSVNTWIDECALRFPHLNCVPLLGTKAQNLARLQGPGDVFIICYASAVAAISKKVPDPNKPGKSKWSITAAEVRQYFAGFTMLIMDEVHKCKDVSTLTYRMCRAISAEVEYSVGLTGTPFGRDLSDLWPQFYLADFGETLGPSLGFFRGVFFSDKDSFWGGAKYKFKRKLFPVLKRIIKNRSIHYSVDEFADMPPKIYVPKRLNLPREGEGYINVAKDDLRKAIIKGDLRETENNYLKLRQLASGYMTLHGQTEKLKFAFKDNPKLDQFEELVDEMDPEHKMVVFHHFVFTNQLISERLKEMKIKHARVWGGQRDQVGELRRFKQDPDCRVLVINDKSGSSSLNLQHANYLVFFEQPDSPIDREQAEARVWRPGQARRVFVCDLLMRNTVDDQIRASTKAGKNLLNELWKGRSKLK